MPAQRRLNIHPYSAALFEHYREAELWYGVALIRRLPPPEHRQCVILGNPRACRINIAHIMLRQHIAKQRGAFIPRRRRPRVLGFGQAFDARGAQQRPGLGDIGIGQTRAIRNNASCNVPGQIEIPGKSQASGRVHAGYPHDGECVFTRRRALEQ